MGRERERKKREWMEKQKEKDARFFFACVIRNLFLIWYLFGGE